MINAAPLFYAQSWIMYVYLIQCVNNYSHKFWHFSILQRNGGWHLAVPSFQGAEVSIYHGFLIPDQRKSIVWQVVLICQWRTTVQGYLYSWPHPPHPPSPYIRITALIYVYCCPISWVGTRKKIYFAVTDYNQALVFLPLHGPITIFPNPLSRLCVKLMSNWGLVVQRRVSVSVSEHWGLANTEIDRHLPTPGPLPSYQDARPSGQKAAWV
jgi:hypothetical protein